MSDRILDRVQGTSKSLQGCRTLPLLVEPNRFLQLLPGKLGCPARGLIIGMKQGGGMVR